MIFQPVDIRPASSFRASADKNVGDTAGRNASATLIAVSRCVTGVRRVIFGFIFFQFSVSSGYVESERGQPASDLPADDFGPTHLWASRSGSQATDDA